MIFYEKPKIGVTGPDRGGGAAWLFTAISVLMAGGTPIRIQPSNPRTIEDLHGLIVGGGADVDPCAYTRDNFIEQYLNKTIKNKRKSFFRRIGSFFWSLTYPIVFLIRIFFSKKGHGLDKDRDQLEFNLVAQAEKKGIPVLGICRGSQLINVYFKGSLHQDINPFYEEEPNPYSVFPVKTVFIKAGSKLAEILEVPELRVNALHRQAVKERGTHIEVVAQEENEVVQAIESTTHDFIVGVQWHPEYLVQKKHHRRIFKALVQAAKNHKLAQLKKIA